MEFLLGLIALLFGGFLYTNTKKKSAESLLENNEVHKEANKVDQEISKNTGTLASEEEKRKAIEEKKNEEVKQDPVDFINDRYPSK